MSKDLAKINIKLTADNLQLQKKLEASEKRLEKFSKKSSGSLKKVSGSLKKLSLAAGVAATAAAAGMARLTAQALSTADALGKTSDKLGIMPQKLQALQRAGELTGVSVETTNMALQRMTRRIAEASKDSGEAVGALRELGLSGKELAKLPVDQQFAQIADAMNGAGTQADRVRLSMKLFDSEGVALVNTLKLGSQGFKDIEEEIDSTGESLNRLQIGKIEAANDAITKAKGQFSALGNQLAVKFAPIIKGLVDRFGEFVSSVGGFDDLANIVFNSVIKAVGFVANAFNGLRAVFSGLKALFVNIVSGIVSGLVKIDSAISSFRAKFGFGDGTGSEALQQLSESLKQQASEATGVFNDILFAPIPSEQIQAFVSDTTEKLKTEVKAQQEQAQEESQGDSGALEEVAEEQPWYKALTDKLNFKGQFNKAELDMQSKHEAELKGITDASEKAKIKLRQKKEKEQLGNTKKSLSQGLSILAQSNKAAFNAVKAYNIAEALIEAKKSVVSAYNFGSKLGGPAVGAAFAGVAAVAQAANIKAIASQSFGGGGSVQSAGGSAPSVPSTPAANDAIDTDVSEISAQRQEVTIRAADPFTPSVIRDFMEKLEEEGVDMGYDINFVAS